MNFQKEQDIIYFLVELIHEHGDSKNKIDFSRISFDQCREIADKWREIRIDDWHEVLHWISGEELAHAHRWLQRGDPDLYFVLIQKACEKDILHILDPKSMSIIRNDVMLIVEADQERQEEEINAEIYSRLEDYA